MGGDGIGVPSDWALYAEAASKGPGRNVLDFGIPYEIGVPLLLSIVVGYVFWSSSRETRRFDEEMRRRHERDE